jgi:hypothetical protein
MPETTTTTTSGFEEELIAGASVAIKDTLEGGQSRSLGEMSRSNASIDSMIKASDWAARKGSRANGSRPLMRRLNLGNMGYN